MPAAHRGAGRHHRSKALLHPAKHRAGEKGMHPPWTGRDSPLLQAFWGHHGDTPLSWSLLALPVPACTDSWPVTSASIRMPSFSVQAASGWPRNLCLSLLGACTEFDPCFLTMIQFACWILWAICERKREPVWRAGSHGIRWSQGYWCHLAVHLLTPEKLESLSMEDALPGCFVQNPWKLLAPRFWFENIKPFFLAIYPHGSPVTAALVSLSLHLSFLMQAGEAPALLKETCS